jgi:hypothetical protein
MSASGFHSLIYTGFTRCKYALSSETISQKRERKTSKGVQCPGL